MTNWSPSKLPNIRDETVRAHERAAARHAAAAADPRYASAAAEVGVDPDADLGAALRALANQYRVANLYWVTPQMARVALDASATLPEWTPIVARPSNFGLLVWDRGLPPIPWQGAPQFTWATNALGVRTPPQARVDAIMWSPDSAGIRIGVLTRSDLLGDALTDEWAHSPLFAFADLVMALDRPASQSGLEHEGLLSMIGATWLLMQQPTIADSRPLDPCGGRGGSGRPPRPEREVRIIDLRRAAESGPRQDARDSLGRVYRHRWLVSGHWRQQAVGQGRAQRRPTWVVPHVKGPEGAPMLQTDRVRVWRR